MTIVKTEFGQFMAIGTRQQNSGYEHQSSLLRD